MPAVQSINVCDTTVNLNLLLKLSDAKSYVPNIKLTYLYRDGGNYKNWNEVVFGNPHSRCIGEIEQLPRERMFDGTWFYADEWNLPDMHFTNWDPQQIITGMNSIRCNTRVNYLRTIAVLRMY